MKGSNDSLFKIRPLLNTIKHTFAAFFEIGSEVCIDEASSACRSKFGRFFIFYCGTKPTGKYHFRFYLLCCCDTWACFRIRMATKDHSDCGDGTVPQSRRPKDALFCQPTDGGDDEPEAIEETDPHKPPELIEEEERQEDRDASKNLKLVLDMCKPLIGTGITVTMDNFYTSVEVALRLKENRIFCRGTARMNRYGFPKSVGFSKPEARTLKRGAIKKRVDRQKGITCYCWLDSKAVTLVTIADETAITNVWRQINSVRQPVQAPVTVPRYNSAMQGVDHHDQLRKLFSLSDRHGFKKSYVKIALTLIDLALTNAWIAFKMANPNKCESKSARRNFTSEIATELLNRDWTNHTTANAASSPVANEDDMLRSLLNDEEETEGRQGGEGSHPEVGDDGLIRHWNTNCPQCVPDSVSAFVEERSSRRGLSCQTCSFEGRGSNMVKHVEVCRKHRLRCCTISRPPARLTTHDGNEVTDLSWMPHDQRMTCWEKAHCFYIPNGLFSDEPKGPPTGKNGKMKFQAAMTGSLINQKKRVAFGRNAVVSVPNRRKKPLNKTRSEKRTRPDEFAIATRTRASGRGENAHPGDGDRHSD